MGGHYIETIQTTLIEHTCTSYSYTLSSVLFFSHRSVAVKRSMSCFISASLERFGAGKFLHCSKDVLDKVLPALIQLTTDPSPEARY